MYARWLPGLAVVVGTAQGKHKVPACCSCHGWAWWQQLNTSQLQLCASECNSPDFLTPLLMLRIPNIFQQCWFEAFWHRFYILIMPLSSWDMGQGLPGCTAWDTIKIGVRWPHPSSAGVFCLRKGKNPCLILTAGRAKQERILSIYLAIETSHFFCSLDQLTGGRMEGDLEKEVFCVCACLSIQQRHK